MSISPTQAEVLRVIAANRCPVSYLAGATIVHRKPDSPRTSLDLDFFHELEDSIAVAGEADAKALTEAGYDLQWLLRTPTFYRAIVTANDVNALRIYEEKRQRAPPTKKTALKEVEIVPYDDG